ncbi:hypothetical protein N7457_007848 [Penicillium paradoxum]|uniref:uncharacterized protein n=1 Tax=Penicillium paradoxum TaxID=176176 RepID=UPI0025492E4D|nr:uncharacterized protein N7457_007848 [Penicillium paradoxum]KAJ5772952.1 hypothetical protein N7457_007848 [Penicillium paradoxum]
MATTLAEHISLEKFQDHYISRHLPQRLGNPASIAYGGYAIALAIHAAYKSVPDGFHLHSVLGHYLRPVSTEIKLICTPIQLRKSRGFITYRVNVEQKDPSTGNLILCMELSADFHKDEPSVLTHSASPSRSYPHWRDCATWESVVEENWLKPGKITEKQANIFNTLFKLSRDLYDGRPCPEGITTQNMLGFAKTAKTTQDGLSPTEKASADWVKVKHPLRTEAEQMAGLGFLMDGILAFLPLAHNHMFFDDVGACSSLDFALRIFVPHPKMDEWHLREIINQRAGHGRTYTEAKLWDDEGNLVASMTQQSILRAKPVKL